MQGRKPFRIVVAEPFAADAVDRLKEIGEVTILEDSAPDTLIAAVAEADALLVRSKAHVTARIIDAAPRLKVIARASQSIDHIDLRAARRREIPVVYAPHAAVNSSAEFTLGLMLALRRRIIHFDRQVREGRFEIVRKPEGRDLGKAVVGFLGWDSVAERLAEMLSSAFGSPLLHHVPDATGAAGATPAPQVGRSAGLDELLAESDVLTVHLRATPETRGFLNAERLARMKATAIVVNTGRGPVIDTIALAEALRKRHIAGAALDVFETEPLPMDHPLRRAPNCILTPHVAGMTEDATLTRYDVTEDVLRVLRGERPEHAVEAL